MYSQGFWLSYAEVLRIERCAATFRGTNVPDLVKHQNYSVEVVADDVDHNAKTMDGKNTFHGMGIIVAVTPCLKLTTIIPRLQDVPSADLVKLAETESQKLIPRQKIKAYFKVLPQVTPSDECQVDYDWACTWLLNPAQPSWSGFMQMVQDGVHHGPASILFMPMIDQKSTNPVCILSTINFVYSLAKKYSMTPILTFDQPLYWKAMELQVSFSSNNDIHKFVLRLGGFHMCMSFLRAIGHLMQGSGISSVFEQIYAELSVPAILSGKEMSRRTRAIFCCMEH